MTKHCFALLLDSKQEFCNDFDLRKPLERHFLIGKQIDCVSTQDAPNLVAFHDRCATFLSQFSRLVVCAFLARYLTSVVMMSGLQSYIYLS